MWSGFTLVDMYVTGLLMRELIKDVVQFIEIRGTDVNFLYLSMTLLSIYEIGIETLLEQNNCFTYRDGIVQVVGNRKTSVQFI